VYYIGRIFGLPLKGKGGPYSITECRVPVLIPVLGSQPAGEMSHKPDDRLPLLSVRPIVTLATLKRAATNVNSLPKTVTRQRRDCDLNPGPSAPESSTLTTRLPSHPGLPLRDLYRPTQSDETAPTRPANVPALLHDDQNICGLHNN